MDKETVAAKLRELFGREALVERGVLKVAVTEEEYKKYSTYECIRDQLKEIGYNASWGYAPVERRGDDKN